MSWLTDMDAQQKSIPVKKLVELLTSEWMSPNYEVVFDPKRYKDGLAVYVNDPETGEMTDYMVGVICFRLQAFCHATRHANK